VPAQSAKSANALARSTGATPPSSSLIGDQVDPGALVDLAIDQRVAGALHASYPDLDGRLVDQIRLDTMRHLAAQASLRALRPVLDAAAIPWAVVKGPVLAELSYGDVARAYGDLDIVVAADRFETAVAMLTAVGYRVADRNWRLVCQKRAAQLHLVTTTGDIGVDLHWHLVNPQRQRQRWRIPMAELLARRAVAAPVDAPTLEVTDRLIHYALHVAVSGGYQLGWIKDIERTVANDPPNWDDLVERSRRWRVGLPVAAMLQLATYTLGAAVPLEVVPALVVGRTQRLLVQALRSWTPRGRLPGGGSLDRATIRSLADTVPATLVGLVGQAAAMVDRQIHPHPFWLDPAHPRNMLFPAGGDAERAQYFALVRSTDRFGHNV
jgi:Uncharacterised nucleotidyltransferase